MSNSSNSDRAFLPERVAVVVNQLVTQGPDTVVGADFVLDAVQPVPVVHGRLPVVRGLPMEQRPE